MKFLKLFLAFLLCTSFANAQRLPTLRSKPTPRFESRSFCPAVGLESSSQNDPILNKAKNRTDDASRYFNVDFDEIKNLARPPGLTGRQRGNWTQEVTDAVAQSEGIPIRLEGFLVLTGVSGAVLQGSELCNCQRREPEFRDLHLWLVKRVGHDKTQSVVIEMTPRVRKNHPEWTIARLTDIATRRLPVRVSGWLMMDQEHLGHIGEHRANAWEIHPIMKFEFKERNRWRTL